MSRNVRRVIHQKQQQQQLLLLLLLLHAAVAVEMFIYRSGH